MGARALGSALHSVHRAPARKRTTRCSRVRRSAQPGTRSKAPIRPVATAGGKRASARSSAVSGKKTSRRSRVRVQTVHPCAVVARSTASRSTRRPSQWERRMPSRSTIAKTQRAKPPMGCARAGWTAASFFDGERDACICGAIPERAGYDSCQALADSVMGHTVDLCPQYERQPGTCWPPPCQ